MLAVETQKGLAYAKRGSKVLREFVSRYKCDVVIPPEDSSSPVDGYIIRDDDIVAVAEAKVRQTHSFKELGGIDGTYLITRQKLDDLIVVGKALHVPSLLVVELACKTRYWWKIADRDGNILVTLNDSVTRTKYNSISSRTVERLNSFIPFGEGSRW